MGFEALFLGKETHIFGAPFYAGWNLENLIWHLDKNKKEEILKRRGKSLTIEEVFYGAYCLYSKYFNPFSKEKSNLVDTVETIAKYREIYLKNSGDLYFFGFSFWKRKNSLNFFKTFKKGDVFFCKNLDDALTKGLKSSSKIFIWGKKEFEEVEEFAKEKSIEIFRVEDGFVRSVTLGSDLTKAYSLVVDSRGIYFDPNSSSDLEEILNTHKFDKKTLKRAEKIRDYLIENRISKYNIHRDKKLNFNTSKKIVLVVGQVEDDASIIYGGEKMSNLELLKRVYEKRKDEFIIYKPHPDVEAGNRKGKIDKKIALKYANEVISDISLPSLLDACDELHTITSLSGFEALIRGKKVYTYGLPFYASWGLTIDEKSCKRRTRKLSILELIAGSYILYPRYIDPESGKLCEIEVTLKNIELMKRKYNSSRLYRFAINIRNFISRKSQLILKVILGE
jgi:capsular polysaccharide export protein